MLTNYPHVSAYSLYLSFHTILIYLQSKFLDSTDRALLLKFAGTVEAGSIAEYGDDGVSQKATVKTGIASKGDALVPSPVSLVPFRTFVEVQQPVSSFVLRMKQDKYLLHVVMVMVQDVREKNSLELGQMNKKKEKRNQ